MSPFLQDLYKSFQSVGSQYYFQEALKDPMVILDGAKNRQTFIQLTERQFASELYHEWRNTMSSPDSKGNYSDLMIGFEVSKKFIKNDLVENKASFTPDLVLHQSQTEFHPDCQKIYIEIKTNPSLTLKRIKHDLNKILFAMNQYRFEHGVFISVNSNIDRLKKLISDYIDKKDDQYNHLWERLYLFHSEPNESPQIFSFSQISNTTV